MLSFLVLHHRRCCSAHFVSRFCTVAPSDNHRYEYASNDRDSRNSNYGYDRNDHR